MMLIECDAAADVARSIADHLVLLTPVYAGRPYVLDTSTTRFEGRNYVAARPTPWVVEGGQDNVRAFLNSLAELLVGVTGFRFAHIGLDPEGAVNYERLTTEVGYADEEPGLVISDAVYGSLPARPHKYRRLWDGYWWRPYLNERA